MGMGMGMGGGPPSGMWQQAASVYAHGPAATWKFVWLVQLQDFEDVLLQGVCDSNRCPCRTLAHWYMGRLVCTSAHWVHSWRWLSRLCSTKCVHMLHAALVYFGSAVYIVAVECVAVKLTSQRQSAHAVCRSGGTQVVCGCVPAPKQKKHPLPVMRVLSFDMVWDRGGLCHFFPVFYRAGLEWFPQLSRATCLLPVSWLSALFCTANSLQVWLAWEGSGTLCLSELCVNARASVFASRSSSAILSALQLRVDRCLCARNTKFGQVIGTLPASWTALTPCRKPCTGTGLIAKGSRE